jgi:hypothetical protein
MWTVGKVAKELDDDKGTSLVIANTAKGMSAVDGLDKREVPFDAATEGNGGFAASAEIPQRRDEFFTGYLSAKDLIAYMKGFVVRRPLHVRIYRKVRHILSTIKRRITE